MRCIRPPFRRHDRRFRGFTLLELMLVVTMLAIVAMLVTPTAKNHATLAREAASLLVADLNHAQLQSLGNSADPCVVVFDSDGGGYHLARASDPTAPITDPTTQSEYATRFGDGRARGLHGVVIQELTADTDDRLQFTSMGALEHGDDGVVTFKCGDSTITLRVDADTGAVTTE